MVEDLEVRDSMQMHVAIAYSWDVVVSKLLIIAPGWSPNTDGIHVSNSKEVSISECTISTGIYIYILHCDVPVLAYVQLRSWS